MTLHGFLRVPDTPTAFRQSHIPAFFRYASAALNVQLKQITSPTYIIGWLGGGLVNCQVDRASFCIFKPKKVAYIVTLFHL
jgi:hypothetical protein